MRNNNQGGKHLLKRKSPEGGRFRRRGVSLLLCLCMAASLFAGVVTFPALAREAAEAVEAEPVEETREEIKARLLRQAREGWDPYSAENMSMDEFYALMELFQDGALPLESAADEKDEYDAGTYAMSPDARPYAISGSSGTPAAPLADTGAASEYIPRQMFLFSGVNPEDAKDEDGEDISSQPGAYRTYDEEGNVASEEKFGSPLNYDNQTGAADELTYYPAGLDRAGNGYTRPPKGWPGIEIDSNSKSVTITVPGVNDGNSAVSGDVDQKFFLDYDGVYVRKVTARSNGVIILGAIQPREGGLVYYYTSDIDQDTKVSATTLPAGEKFIVEYAHREYALSHQIRFRPTDEEFEAATIVDGSQYLTIMGYNLVRDKEYVEKYKRYYDNYDEFNTDNPITLDDGTTKDADIADWVRQLPRLVNEANRVDLDMVIFGEEFPAKTDEGKYSFSASAPNGFTLAFYMASDTDNSGTWVNGSAQLVTPAGYNGGPGAYTRVNQGWALGMEPVYAYNTDDNKMMPVESKGPQELVTNATIYNNDVDADRIVVAVLRKRDTPEPIFDAYNLINGTGVDGNSNDNNNVKGRGTSAKPTVKAKIKGTEEEVTIPYDYEDLYLWATGGESVYDYFNNADSMGDADKGNLSGGNIATIDNWGWNNDKDNRKLNDAVLHPMNAETDDDGNETGTYSYQWTFQTNSGDNFVLDTLEINRTGIAIPFHAKRSVRDGNYGENLGNDNGDFLSWWAETILPDGAVVKVELLMLFADKPQRVYRITVTGARNNITVTNMNLMQYDSGAKEISVYDLDGVTGDTSEDSNIRKTAILYYSTVSHGWTGNKNRGEVIVDRDEDEGGVDYSGGDSDVGGANIRFKLASGYSNPAYLLENRVGAVIEHDGAYQASIDRNGEDLSLDRSTQNPVVPYISDGEDPYMRYDKDGVPYPVDSAGNELYYKDDDEELVPFTDWTILRVYADGSLAPELYDSEGNALDKDEVIAGEGTCVFKWEQDKKLNPQYIYSGTEGWYYIRLTGHEDNALEKFALLTVVAFPTRYVVRYKPINVPEIKLADESVIEAHPPEDMPAIEHFDECPLFLQVDPEEDEDDNRERTQFDDNDGDFYDIVTYANVAVSRTQPTDPKGYFHCVGWKLVDENDNPVKDGDGNEVIFTPGSGFSVPDYADYAIYNSDLGAISNDIYVFRLVPEWEREENPYHYKVALRWVTAQGELNEEGYLDDENNDGMWRSVLTNYDPTQGVGPTVKILTDATPFQDWIAQHPTYTFWNAVNNATGEGDVEEALADYFPVLADDATPEDKATWQENYEAALEAILQRDRHYDPSDENYDRYVNGDDFDPLGNYTYAVYEDYGTIVIWMFEDKGGLVFHKAVDAEPFTTDEEFYFTVSQETAGGNQSVPLEGEYKAYPEAVYNERTGLPRPFEDSDALRVTFKEGEIISVVENDGSVTDHFTVKNGEGIRLYVPAGRYTISELGSQSGGVYRTEVTYVAAEDNEEEGIVKGMEQAPKEGWEFPDDYMWLTGSGGNSIPATVDVVVGEKNVVQTINFSNQTSTVAIESQVVGPYSGEAMGYEATLILPETVMPLESEDGSYYYFNFNLYDVTYPDGTTAKYKSEYFPVGFTPPEQRANPGDDDYEKWWAYHTWRPDGITSVNASGRVVMVQDTITTSDGEKTTAWVAQYLLVPDINVFGVQEGWRRLRSATYDGRIWLTSGQRFYVVCTVPKQDDDINYYIRETVSNSYTPDENRDRSGKAVAAELAYELFINTKLAGLPKTGGTGDGMFRIAGLVFLASGLGLIWLNRAKRRWGK